MRAGMRHYTSVIEGTRNRFVVAAECRATRQQDEMNVELIAPVYFYGRRDNCDLHSSPSSRR
jgi:hypothetical protein